MCRLVSRFCTLREPRPVAGVDVDRGLLDGGPIAKRRRLLDVDGGGQRLVLEREDRLPNGQSGAIRDNRRPLVLECKDCLRRAWRKHTLVRGSPCAP